MVSTQLSVGTGVDLWMVRQLPFWVHQPVRDDNRYTPVKEIEHPIMNPVVARPKLINFVPEVIRFGPPKFVAEFLQALQLGLAFLNHLRSRSLNHSTSGTMPFSSW